MTISTGIAAVLAAASALTIVALPAASASERTPTHGAAQELNATDRAFLEGVGASLKFEAAAGALAENQADMTQLKNFGNKDQAFSERLADALEKIAGKKSVKLPARPSAEQAQVLAKLKTLKGGAFDKAFVREAGSAHHFELLNAFKRTAERSVDVDVRGFARSWIDEVNQRFTMINAVTSDVDPKALKPSPDTAPRRADEPRDNMQRDPSGKAVE